MSQTHSLSFKIARKARIKVCFKSEFVADI